MYDVCIVGLGYVGLPSACAFARAGLDTIGVDVRPQVVDLVKKGRSHLTEAGLGDEVKEAVDSGKLHATGNLAEAVANSTAVVIAVQTPLQRGRVVLDFLERACRQVAKSIRAGTIVVLESTVPTGTCKNKVVPILEAGGKKDGKDFFFAYCPERIAPGNSLNEFVNNDRIIGAFESSSFERAESLLKTAVKGKLLRTEVLNAEAAKLVENTARDVYIAFANDLARIGWRAGWDSREVIRLANTHPRVKILTPGPGVGGPCLTKDPFLLLEGVSSDGDHVGSTIRSARKLNDSMYAEVMLLLDDAGPPRKGSKVAVLGTSYKPEVGDPRGSPSERVIKKLLKKGLDVWAYDPYSVEAFGARMAKTVEEAAEGSRSLLILVAHRAFADLDIDKLASLMAPQSSVIDAVGITEKGKTSRKFKLRRLGDGTTREKRTTRAR